MCALVSESSCVGEVSVLCVVWGRLAVGVGTALEVWVWEGGAGWRAEGREARAHRYGVTAACWAPGGGRLLASGGVDGCVRLWGARPALTARRLLAAPGAPAVRALCWAGARLLSGHDDGRLRVWLAARGALLATLDGGGGALYAVAAPPPFLLTACTEGVLKVWDLHALVSAAMVGASLPLPLLWEDGAHDEGALCAASTPDGRLVATGGRDYAIRLWVVGVGEGMGTVAAGCRLVGHEAEVTALCWGRGRRLAAAAADGAARLWAVSAAGNSGECVLTVTGQARYVAAVALDATGRVLLAGAGRVVRTWALDGFRVHDELEPVCALAQHYGVGDLQGIEPVGDELVQRELDDMVQCSGGQEVARLAGSAGHGGAVNGIVSMEMGSLLATVSSDGSVRVFSWQAGVLSLQRTVSGDGYPLLALTAAGGGAGGALLAVGGLGGGCRLLDVASGVCVRALSPGAGGGAVRGARLSPHHPSLLLLATDAGTVPLYDLQSDKPHPIHVYVGHAGAALSVCWSPGGAVAASGGEAGAVMLHAPPPNARTLATCTDAHELGVMSMEFAPGAVSEAAGAGDAALLATAGADGLVKLWLVDVDEAVSSASLRVVHVVAEASGGMSCVAWGPHHLQGGALLATGGVERWARVWRVTAGEGPARAALVGAAPVTHAGGAVAVHLLEGGYLALGTMEGELAVWEVPGLLDALQTEPDTEPKELEQPMETAAACEQDGEWWLEEQWDADPRWWGARGAARWLRDHAGERAARAALRGGLTGLQLLRDPLPQLLDLLTGGAVEDEAGDGSTGVRVLLAEELRWLREPPQIDELSVSLAAPHGLLCPLSHRLMLEPARAADGITYERAALREWYIAAGGCVSFVSGRCVGGGGATTVALNTRALTSVRALLTAHGAAPAAPL